ncbi:hypothetical protein DFJ74DRAFT_691134 [Hyaloraphidium curvatum]|nr:hypothetical protein DFJ74DRAFT_691134 [Hyaloraphidium curvatum]
MAANGKPRPTVSGRSRFPAPTCRRSPTSDPTEASEVAQSHDSLVVLPHTVQEPMEARSRRDPPWAEFAAIREWQKDSVVAASPAVSVAWGSFAAAAPPEGTRGRLERSMARLEATMGSLRGGRPARIPSADRPPASRLEDQVAQLKKLLRSLDSWNAFRVNKRRSGTVLSPFEIIGNCAGEMPAEVGLPALTLFDTILGLDDHLLDRYLQFYYCGRFKLLKEAGAAQLTPEVEQLRVRRNKLAMLGGLIGVPDALIGKLENAELVSDVVPSWKL